MQALKACQINAWLPLFKHLAYKTEIIELPLSWTEFLTADRVFVEDASRAVRACKPFAKLKRYIADGWPLSKIHLD